MKTPSPKAAKATTDLVALSRTGSDLDALVTALSEAQQEIEAATRDREAAEIAYREGLLDATPAELERLQSVKARAKIDVDRRLDAIMGAPEAEAEERRLVAFALALRVDLSADTAVLLLRQAPALRTVDAVSAWVAAIPVQPGTETRH